MYENWVGSDDCIVSFLNLIFSYHKVGIALYI